MNYVALDKALEYLNNGIIEESTTLDKSPEELSVWMNKNIKYRNFFRLMSHDEVMEKKCGSCHDQVMFELVELRKFHPKAMFCIELDDKGQGGVTHSFVYFNRNGKVCWFENAWKKFAGVWEFNSFNSMKEYIKENFQGNKQKYPNIEFTSFKHHEPGETLQELVDKCFGN